MSPIKNVKFLNRDIFDVNTKNQISNYFNGNLDVIISDMAMIQLAINRLIL